MKICAVQIRPVKGKIEENIARHLKLVEAAIKNKADVVFFPELSITSYESKIAAALAIEEDDNRFDVFQNLSDRHNITISVGAPVRCQQKILIGMIIFQPRKERTIYFKQRLHADELPYFSPGTREVFLEAKNRRIAPAICYESLLDEHAEHAFNNQAQIYLASVAKLAQGIDKAARHYPVIAQKFGMTVIMANCLGSCDDFESVGQSAVWNDRGGLVARLDDQREGLLIYDLTSGHAQLEQSENSLELISR